jgi:CTP:molybdopterin cytidylyltransferase MocA
MAEPPHIAVLAAGGATRFGGGKLDAICAGKPLGRWVLDAVATAGLPTGMIVVGEDGAQFAGGMGWELVPNPRASEGLGTSLALAARLALVKNARALVVLLADMPLLDAGFLRRLAGSTPPNATLYPDGDPGVPAVFGRAQLPALAELNGDRGASALLALMDGLTVLEAPAGMLADVDTAHDLVLVESQLSAR